MKIATSSFDGERAAVLFARLPEPLDNSERRQKYDEPLATAMREAGVEGSVRGFSQVGDDGKVAWVGIEVNLRSIQDTEFVVKRLFEFGAPANTRIQIETGDAVLELDLHAMAR